MVCERTCVTSAIQDSHGKTLTQKLLVTEECQRLALVGLGGVGKTQIALEFAYTVKATRPEFSIFWMVALSAESFEHACAEIARKLHINQTADDKEDVKELVRQYLSTETAGRWLLVVDNADDTDVLFGSGSVGSNGIADYLPDSKNGLILFNDALSRGGRGVGRRQRDRAGGDESTGSSHVSGEVADPKGCA
jgi:hypothetical protein